MLTWPPSQKTRMFLSFPGPTLPVLSRNNSVTSPCSCFPGALIFVYAIGRMQAGIWGSFCFVTLWTEPRALCCSPLCFIPYPLFTDGVFLYTPRVALHPKSSGLGLLNVGITAILCHASCRLAPIRLSQNSSGYSLLEKTFYLF